MEASEGVVGTAAEQRTWERDGYSIHQVGADKGGEAFLLRTDSGATALFDTGFAYCAPRTLENIYAVTQGRPVDKIVITHSHYDHCAAMGYLLEHMPDTKVIASAYAAYVFTRPGAYKTMRQMNADRAQSLGLDSFEDVRDNMSVDIVLEDGDCFSVGNLDFKAIGAAGHTKCCMSYWCQDKGLFFATETSGMVCGSVPDCVSAPDNVKYLVDLIELVGFQRALDHIEHVRKLPISLFVASHYGCIEDENVEVMWASVDYWKDFIVNMVVGMHKQGCPIDKITAEYKDLFYWHGSAPYQPESAFHLNASYALPTIIREYCGEDAIPAQN